MAALTEGEVDMITAFQNTAISTLQNTENVEVVTMEATFLEEGTLVDTCDGQPCASAPSDG